MNIFKKKKNLDNYYHLPIPNNSIEFFEKIKNLSEKYWNNSDINQDIFGFQIQKGTKWKDGLSENELSDFQTQMKIEFPEGLKNFYRTMNGLDKEGINVFGSNGTEPNFNPIYYSYPENLKQIRENINWIYKSNGVKIENIEIPKIFPITGHRFLILDENNQILSMYGDDIIFWSENISKLIGTEIFENIENVSDFESNPNFVKPIKFWQSE
ncbi:SMI1/KNR4 family protein [uncultured Lacinutrix sp.]|uniref:SMI1/KNR4 family protein n=1 Tax=uncultured Lacinutrix sp. TaxID=574032 RepID=UPI0026334226|nr:SMI1/KNR4 family protein [uncultured Lacinutrix sp.]